MEKQLQEIQDHYQKEFDLLKDQRDKLVYEGITDVYLIEDRMKALCSGIIALGKVKQLQHVDNLKDNYSSLVVYQKDRNKVFNSLFV